MRSVTSLMGAMVVVVISTIGHGLPVGAGEAVATSHFPEEQRALLREYRSNYERLEKAYGDVYMEAIHRRSDPSDPSDPRRNKTDYLVYRSRNGESLRFDVCEMNPADESLSGQVTVRLVRPEVGLQMAERQTAEQGFYLSGWDSSMHKGYLVDYKFHQAPYALYIFPAHWIVFERPAFLKTAKIEEVVCTEEGGDRLVTIRVSGLPKKVQREWRAQIVLYRDMGWAIKEARSGLAEVQHDDEVFCCECRYEGMEDGIPLLKRAKYWREIGPSRRLALVEEFDIQKIKLGKVPEEEFTLAALGIEVGEAKADWTSRVIGVLVTVVVLVALYFVLRRARREQRGKHTATGAS